MQKAGYEAQRRAVRALLAYAEDLSEENRHSLFEAIHSLKVTHAALRVPSQQEWAAELARYAEAR